MKNCVDILLPFTEALERQNVIDVQLVGGIGSAALAHEDTVIDVDNKNIIAPSDIIVPQFRKDGTKRDIDILVLSTDQDRQTVVEEMAKMHIGSELKISVFGLHRITQLQHQIDHPFGWSAMKTSLSDRYMPDNPSAPGMKAVFPFCAPIDNQVLETWNLQIGDSIRAGVPHPGTSFLNYLTRSISGLRPKDEEKVEEMASLVFEKHPEIADWIVHGPGSSQLELARILQGLYQPYSRQEALTLGNKITIAPYTKAELLEHDGFMLSEATPDVQIAAIGIARAKARALHTFENNPWIVKQWQRHIESHADSLVKNI